MFYVWERKYIENRLGTVRFYHTKATCKDKERKNQHTSKFLFSLEVFCKCIMRQSVQPLRQQIITTGERGCEVDFRNIRILN